MSSYQEPKGIVRGGRHLLYAEDGSRRSDQEIVRECGILGLRLAKLDEYLHRLNQRPVALPYPPKVFIAYKWSDSSHGVWVRRLAEGIAARGFEVIFDQFKDDADYETLEEFVAQIGECLLFVPVIDERYMNFSSAQHGHSTYAYDELDIALIRANAGAMEILPVVREWPEFWSSRVPRSPLIDLSDDRCFEEVLDKAFRYEGPRLTPDEKRKLIERSSQALSLRMSGDTAGALEVFRSITVQYPFVRDAWVQQVQIHIDAGNLNKALETARNGIDHVLPFDNPGQLQTYAVLILKDQNQPMVAFQMAAKVLKGGIARDLRHQIHAVMGDILDDQENLIAARNHLTWACSLSTQPVAMNCLGVTYMHLGEWDKALEWFKCVRSRFPHFKPVVTNVVDTLFLAGRRDECLTLCNDILNDSDEGPVADHVRGVVRQVIRESRPAVMDYIQRLALRIQSIPLPWFRCRKCEAVYPLDADSAICGDCGAIVRKQDERCPHCLNTGRVPVEYLDALNAESAVVGCPICREGSMTRSHEKTF